MKKTVGIIIGGIIAVVGLAAMLKPFQGYFELGWLVGGLLLIHGIERFYRNVVEKSGRKKQMVLRILEAIVGAAILAGTIMGVITDSVVAFAAGAVVVLFGVYFILNGIRVAERNSGKILRATIGLLIVGVGAALLYEPEGTMLAVIYTVATAFALQGVDIIMISMVGRKEAFEDIK